jgi:hypothetical protein
MLQSATSIPCLSHPSLIHVTLSLNATSPDRSSIARWLCSGRRLSEIAGPGPCVTDDIDSGHRSFNKDQVYEDGIGFFFLHLLAFYIRFMYTRCNVR